MGTLCDGLVAVEKGGGGSRELGWYSCMELGELWHQVHVGRTGQPEYLSVLDSGESGVLC